MSRLVRLDYDADRLFFCFGAPKTGTTWLQMLLNAHPDIHCPAEHCFVLMRNALRKILVAYADEWAAIDSRCGQQGVHDLLPEDLVDPMRALVLSVVAAGQRTDSAARMIGANDNTIIDQLPFWRHLFPGVRLIAIVRDPRDVAISNWHHNLRVEPDFTDRAGTFEGWARTLADRWAQRYANILKFAGSQLRVVRYEDLRARPDSALAAIYDYLGVQSDSSVIAAALAATDFDTVRARNNNAFFRQGRAGGWRDDPLMTAALAQELAERAGPAFGRFKYTLD